MAATRSTLALPAMLIMLAAGGSSPALAKDPIRVTIDRALVMPISRPADTVIIGNPIIADATVRDAKTLIITGKSYGTTNLIVLDVNGGQIDNELLTVVPGEDQVVTVYRRSDRQTLSCTPACAPSITLGDNKDVFDSTKGQISGRGELAGAGN